MTGTDVDLRAYFERIGFGGEAPPTLDTLRAVHQLHAQSIAFENLSSFSGEFVPLDLASLQRKMIGAHRGGYCFEQNTLFWRVLEQLGFQVEGLAARVLWGAPAGERRARGHMLLLVTVESERFIADVGFGGMTQTAPLRLDSEHDQATPHETFRIIHEDHVFRLEAEVAHQWMPLYRFDLQRQTDVDYDVWNWWTCTNPNSIFVTGLMLGRPAIDGRHALFNNKYSFYGRQNSASASKILSTVTELKRVLTDAFEIQLPRTSTTLDARLGAIIDATRS